MSQLPPPPPPPGGWAPPPPPPTGGWAAPSFPQSTPTRAASPLATPGRRLLGHLLDLVLLIVTLIIGWLIWSFVIWGDGVSPAKKILGLRVVKKDTGATATWGTMALREIVGKFLLMAVLSFIPGLPLVLDFMLLWDKDRQQLWDKVATTVVVDDRAVAAS